jgi:hypothetical protein
MLTIESIVLTARARAVLEVLAKNVDDGWKFVDAGIRMSLVDRNDIEILSIDKKLYEYLLKQTDAERFMARVNGIDDD